MDPRYLTKEGRLLWRAGHAAAMHDAGQREKTLSDKLDAMHKLMEEIRDTEGLPKTIRKRIKDELTWGSY